EQRAARIDLIDFHERRTRSRKIRELNRQRLRHRECEHRNQRRGNWRRIRRGKKYRRRPRKRKRLLEKLHATPDEYDQFFERTAAGAGNSVWRRRGEFNGVVPTAIAESCSHGPVGRPSILFSGIGHRPVATAAQARSLSTTSP